MITLMEETGDDTHERDTIMIRLMDATSDTLLEDETHYNTHEEDT